jgi:general secretion pathway protein L
MLQKLLLRPLLPLPESGPVLFDWVLADVDGDILKTGKAQELELIDQTLMQNGLDKLSACCLWPASACLSTLAQMPGRPSRVNAQMLAFAVEEQVAQDIEEVHIAQGVHLGDGRFVVRCIDRTTFRLVFDELTREGWSFKLRQVLVDADLLSGEEADLVVLVSGEQVWLRHRASQRCLSTAADNLDAYLNLLVPELLPKDASDVSAGLEILFLVDDPGAGNIDLMAAQLTQYPGVVVRREQNVWPALEYLTQRWLQRRSLPIDLLQGEFKLLSESGGVWQKWRSVAAVAALGLVLQLGVFIGKGYHFQQQARVLETMALEQYGKLVPNAGNITVERLPRIIKGKLNQADTGAAGSLDFLTLLGETGNQYQNSPDKAQVQFKSIGYNEQRGELTIELLAQNFEQLDRLKKAIDGIGFSAKISSAVQEDKHFRGRISVTGS